MSMTLIDADKSFFKRSFWIIIETTREESNDSVELVIFEKTNSEY